MKATLTANLSNNPKRVTKNGKTFLVAPATLIVPGVLHGNRGPLLYPPEEIALSASAWDNQSITLRHPTDNGKSVSFSYPGVKDQQGLGTIRHPYIDKEGRLKAYLWIDESRIKKLDTPLYDNLRKGHKIELSTGLFVDSEPSEGKHGDIPYKFIARNYRPDHLAILPDEEGACSIKAGCGINNHHLAVNNKERKTSSGFKTVNKSKKSGVKAMALSESAKKKMVKQLIANCDCWTEDDEEVLFNLSDESLKREIKRVEVENAEKEKLETIEKELTELKTVHNTVAKELKELKEKKPEEKKEEKVENKEKKEPEKKELTEAEWLEQAPPNVRAAVRNAMAIEEQERARLVEVITKNAPKEKKESLIANFSKRSIEELREIASLIPQKEEELPTGRFSSYIGQGNMPTHNALTEEEENDVLEVPAFDYGKNTKK